ncbi:WhiB family transcriptional regulator [Streptacidiphilus jiangxiensis]|uniref:Transcription factor WhiB n=1 Tax=Streptacidiphilus jiangxiensis TaxID=235985 RepID=A0A1H8BV62_STRJI|nr:WhiB family transcriptional regulator [Streptacidiphilus jiangxiensis]SEM86034.1 Transcription factor WhiB [Streptacidiphilus jiangxiensis]
MLSIASAPETDMVAREKELTAYLASRPIDVLLDLVDHDLLTADLARQLDRPKLTALLERRASCQGEDTDLFYAGDGESHFDGELRRQHVIYTWCTGCPVATACLERALRDKDSGGIHGGLTEQEQRDEARAHAQRLAQARTNDARIAAEESAYLRAARRAARTGAFTKATPLSIERARTAVAELSELRAARRARTGWTA